MLKALFPALLIALSTACLAEGPGSRIRAGVGPTTQPASEPPRPAGPVERDSKRCDALAGAAKDRCMKELRKAMNAPERPPHEGPNPEAAGPGASAPPR